MDDGEYDDPAADTDPDDDGAAAGEVGSGTPPADHYYAILNVPRSVRVRGPKEAP